jgi:ABC-type sugar transport system permease subunit
MIPRRAKVRLPDWAVGYLFILPALVGFVLFYLVPTVRALEVSLTDWNLLRAPKFVALANYDKLLADPTFWNSMWLSLCYVAYNIPVQTTLGLLLAVLSDRLARNVSIRALIIAPYLISNVVAALLWLLMLDPLLGLTNDWLQALGLSRHGFLSSSCSPAAGGPKASTAAGSSNRRSSTTSRSTARSGGRRSSGRYCASAPSRPRQKPSRWPMTAPSASSRR